MELMILRYFLSCSLNLINWKNHSSGYPKQFKIQDLLFFCPMKMSILTFKVKVPCWLNTTALENIITTKPFLLQTTALSLPPALPNESYKVTITSVRTMVHYRVPNTFFFNLTSGKYRKNQIQPTVIKSTKRFPQS